MICKDIDIAVIGGGPAGITACLELDRSQNFSICLFEGGEELGGIPRSCNTFFGMRDIKRVYSGKKYADTLEGKLRKTKVDIHTGSTVLRIIPGDGGDRHHVSVATPDGIRQYNCRSIILATGCFEASRQARLIPGYRPSGIFTTGSLQKLIHLDGVVPGKNAVVIGSELVSLSTVQSLKKAGMNILALIEEASELQTYKLAAMLAKFRYGFAVHTNTKIQSILGENRVEGVRLEKNGTVFDLECDTAVVTGRFRAESSLLEDLHVQLRNKTRAPQVDDAFMTQIPNIYTAGNVLMKNGGRMHDLCALEGKKVAQLLIQGNK